MSKLNPDIKQIHVGIKELRKVHIYPLSMNDQLTLVDELSDAIEKLGNNKEEDSTEVRFKSTEEALEFLKTLITENLEHVLTFVTDEDERPKANEITNNQLFEIVDAIFVVNFEGMVKNFKNLFDRAKNLMSQSQELQQISQK